MTLIKPAESLFLGLMGSPYSSDWTTTFFRLLPAALAQGCDVTVWTCGNATSITSSLMRRDGDPIHPDSPSHVCAHTMPQMAAGLLAAHPDTLRWYVCSYCMEERGASEQIEGPEIKLPFSFDTYLHQADQALVLGTK
ncbi:DsrE/DsrF-like family protein [Monaibacterium marinum]|uniref:DsrE/DsrF-like family protein n=1 Tax=Pontivivens marinum TaxID=1690039 RepID=A0A2C9CUW2_9RHOB|nr:DsrE family protein [Monaibacterium marinum]SOH95000.1 DsrE/DsrF-like family protein [Monaibacterium marinum]